MAQRNSSTTKFTNNRDEPRSPTARREGRSWKDIVGGVVGQELPAEVEEYEKWSEYKFELAKQELDKMGIGLWGQESAPAPRGQAGSASGAQSAWQSPGAKREGRQWKELVGEDVWEEWPAEEHELSKHQLDDVEEATSWSPVDGREKGNERLNGVQALAKSGYTNGWGSINKHAASDGKEVASSGHDQTLATRETRGGSAFSVTVLSILLNSQSLADQEESSSEGSQPSPDSTLTTTRKGFPPTVTAPKKYHPPGLLRSDARPPLRLSAPSTPFVPGVHEQQSAIAVGYPVQYGVPYTQQLPFMGWTPPFAPSQNHYMTLPTPYVEPGLAPTPVCTFQHGGGGKWVDIPSGVFI